MGTNYYARKKDRPEETPWVTPITQHIGKSSAGWCFTLCVNTFKSLDEWKEVFNDPTIEIVDEYEDIVEPSEMIKKITERSFSRERSSLENPVYTVFGSNGLIRHTINPSRGCIGHGEGTWDLMTGNFS